MHEVESLPYAKVDGAALLQIPYSGGDLAMTFVLPDAVEGLADMEAKLSVATLAAWDHAMGSARVSVALPSFEISAGDPLELRGSLSTLGMPLAFDRHAADFTAIANPPAPQDRLYIGDVFHKAYVKLDEHGTEAAAATGVVMRHTLLARRIPPVPFIVDHPFLFLLRDVASGTILFIGHVSDPSLRSHT
jgi:serpin B